MPFTMKSNEFEEVFEGGGFAYIEEKQDPVFESAGGAGDFAGKQIRSQAMSCLLTWIDSGDFTFDNLDTHILGIADMDGDEEVTDDEEEYYNELLAGVSDAMLSFGADAGTVGKFINDEDDSAGEKIGAMISEKLNATESPDEDIVGDYTMADDEPIMESTIKVVRGGQVVKIKKKIRRKKITSLQRASLKKARMKANTGLAKRARMKSMKIRKKRGL